MKLWTIKNAIRVEKRGYEISEKHSLLPGFAMQMFRGYAKILYNQFPSLALPVAKLVGYKRLALGKT